MVDKTLLNHDKRFHENFLQKTLHSALVGALIGISYLPFWVLYGISDLFYLIINYLVKYRLEIITDNLKHAFPEKTDAEIKTITRKYYRHFCDIFVETVKAYSISEKQFKKRIKFHQVEKFMDYFDQGRSLIFFGMHYNNWEWSSFSARFGKHDVLFVYNPLRGNEAFEKFMNHIRGRWGAKTIPVHRSSRIVLTFGKTEKPAAIWLGADQAPPPTSKFWTLFLNRETPFFSGPEKIAHYSNQPVFLHVTRKVGRGKYEVDFIQLFDKPKDEVSDSNEILLAYVRKMEDIIREKPEYYLWSHRRWKHTRPDGIELTL
jgi:KDO2-lipid IV(A) lauroyltransferase